MSNRSRIFILATALLGCLALAACVALFAGGYYFYNNSNALASLFAPAPVNRIVYVGNDSNIYVTDPATGDKTALTQDGDTNHLYNYPTWSPDDQRVAFVGYTLENGSPTGGALYTITPRGENRTSLFKTQQDFPFYLYWSPDSQFVGFLSNTDSQNIALRVAHTDQPDSMQEIDAGSPFYWAWSPDGAQMFTHVGGARADNDSARLALLDFQNKQAPHPLEASPGAFQAPQWSRDGKILISTQDGDTQAISLTDAKSNAIKKLANYSGRASFAIAPDGSHIAFLVTEQDLRIPNYGPVHVVDANGENAELVSDENALAFLWSPDSKKIAFLTIGPTQNQQNFIPPPSVIASNAPDHFVNAPSAQQGGQSRVQLQWKVWDSETKETRLLATFEPTSGFLSVLPYFDQYANSSTFWSPDSQSLVYTSNENQSDGSVWVADVTGKNPVKKIGEGVLAFWSWK